MATGKEKKSTGKAQKVAASEKQLPKKSGSAKISTPIQNGKFKKPKVKSKYKNTEIATPSRPPRKPVRKTKPDIHQNAAKVLAEQEEQRFIAQQLLIDKFKDKQTDFLLDLAETASITKSCKNTGLSKTAYYDLINRDPEFAMQAKEAYQRGLDSMEDEVKRRAFDGYMEPVFYKGDVVGHVRKFSDTLAMFILEAERRNKFGKRVEVKKTDNDVERDIESLSDAELDAEITKLQKELNL